MYSLIVLKPFSLNVVGCFICENMREVLEAAEKIDPNIDVEPLLWKEDCCVETDEYIFKLANPQYVNEFCSA